MADQLIGEYTHLTHLPQAAHALKTLRRLASLVKPIMVQHSFRVGRLIEFVADDNVLGLNYDRGRQISIRLREMRDVHSFIPEEQLVGTMLHELTHNLYGPHDEKFYGFLRKIEEEFYVLKARGWDGEGFYSKGKVLGGVPGAGGRGRAAGMWGRAVEAAGRRARGMPAGGVVLGGGVPGKVLGAGRVLGGPEAPRWRGDLRENAARAAERRAKDNKTCGGKKAAEAANEAAKKNGVRTKAEEDSANDRAILKAQIELIGLEEGVVWVLDDDDDDDDEVQIVGYGPAPGRGSGAGAAWACAACTLINQPAAKACEVCGNARPAPAPPRPGGSRTRPQQEKTVEKAPAKHWSCYLCMTKNGDILQSCTFCGGRKTTS